MLRGESAQTLPKAGFFFEIENMKRNILATITATQPRIATGHDDSAETLMAIITDANDAIQVIPQDRWKRDWKGYATHHGLIRIKHPEIMAGTWEEIHGDMARLVSKWMDENGLVSENDYGVRFLSTSAPEALARLSAAAEVIDAD